MRPVDQGGIRTADFDRALEQTLAPGNHRPQTHNNRGAARHARGDTAGALDDSGRALGLTPRRNAAPIGHDRGAARLGDFDGTIADLGRALELDPGFCVAYISRGNPRSHERDPGCQEDYKTAFLGAVSRPAR
jgi:hypothetical protein